MQDSDLGDFEDLWTSPPGTFELVAFGDSDGFLPCRVDPSQAVLIEEPTLNDRVCERMLRAGVPVRRFPEMCLAGQCPKPVVNEGLCAAHLGVFRADQHAREEQGQLALDARTWADAERRAKGPIRR